MQAKSAAAGQRGKSVRSDCWVNLISESSGGVRIDLQSKVDVLYGGSIRALIQDMARFFQIEHARFEVEDSGAVPFVIMARVETAVRRLGLDGGRQYLPDWNASPPASRRDRFRRSRLYLPGDQPKLFLNAAIHGADGLILDLEDSVAPECKLDARILVRNALRAMDFMGAERMVRINQLPLGLEDLDMLIPQQVDMILVPKVESPAQLFEVERKLEEVLVREKMSTERPIFLMPIIESAQGVINAPLIASASERIAALAIGLEDYTADIGTRRTAEGRESFFARSMLVNAARAAGVQAIDTVFSDVDDMEGLRESVLEARGMGFDGKGCIHPRQIAVIHRAMAPAPAEIEKAQRIVNAFEAAEKQGRGVVSLGSKMIDPPVVKRALRTIDIAEKEGLLPQNWRSAADDVQTAPGGDQ
ncbi:MAG: aldolase/citrate lyase family protein [Acidobacteriota bacterium]|jgi:citrate lyase subunit beta/citryl-CoA lyase|nr:aldolase/citrate lyase family protein [Acidobacteriota bacterium]